MASRQSEDSLPAVWRLPPRARDGLHEPVDGLYGPGNGLEMTSLSPDMASQGLEITSQKIRDRLPAVWGLSP